MEHCENGGSHHEAPEEKELSGSVRQEVPFVAFVLFVVLFRRLQSVGFGMRMSEVSEIGL
jgi:hypothetical protein